MHLAALVFSIAALSPAPQDTNDLRRIDRVEVIVNDEIITWRQVMRTTTLNTPEGTTPTPRLFRKIGNDLIDNYLQVQGGIDMGFEEEDVKRQVTRNTERLIGSEGGMIQMAKTLDDKGISLFDRESDIRRQLYSSSWEQAVTGAKPGVSGRTYQDRYVRPGQLRLRYKLFEANLMEAELIRGTSARYHLQELDMLIPPESEPGLIEASVKGLHQELKDGLDFTSAVQSLPNPPEGDGFRQPLTHKQLAREHPGLALFAISAAPGEISVPVPISLTDPDGGKHLVGWRLIKFLRSDAPELPIFEVPRTQALLRKVIQDEGDKYRRSGGQRALKDGAFTWFASSKKG